MVKGLKDKKKKNSLEDEKEKKKTWEKKNMGKCLLTTSDQKEHQP